MARGVSVGEKGVLCTSIKSRDIQTLQTYLENGADCIILSALVGQIILLRPVAKGYYLIIAPVVGDDGIL